MKVILNTQKLKDCLNYVSRVSMNNKKGGSSPVYSQVQFDFKNNNLILTAYDSSYGIQLEYGSIEYPDNKYLIDAEGILHVAKYSDSETLSFDFKETRLVVTDGGSSYKFNYFITESILSYVFDTLPELTEPLFKTNTNEFIRIAKFLEPCVAKDAARPFLNGIQFDGNFVATDGNICGIYANEEHREESIFFVSEGLDLITSLPEDKEILIYKVNNLNLIICENIKIITPQMAGSFPNYNRIIDSTSNYPYEFAVDKTTLQKLSKKLLPFADIHQRLVATATFSKDGVLSLSAASEGTKEGLEVLTSIQSISPTEDITFHLNIKLLANLVESIPSSLIYIKYSDNTKTPLIITDKGQCSHFLSVYSYVQN